MLYLAEVRKKTGGFMGGGKAELKLLARQEADKSWTAVPPSQEAVQTEDANNFSPDSLVLVDLVNKRAQKLRSAGPELVKILQGFSRIQDQSKSQDEEIKQWQESLMFQSQELSRRELEMETRLEQLSQAEEDAAQVEQQRQEVETSREEVSQLREELERKTQELEGAWAHLHGETRKLEEQKEDLLQSATLDEGQAQKLQETLDALSNSVVSSASIQAGLDPAGEAIATQQGLLEQHWQTLEEQRNTAQQLQDEVDQQAGELTGRWQAWHEAEAGLIETQAAVKAQQGTLQLKQDYREQLARQVDEQASLATTLMNLASGSGSADSGIDLKALEDMPLEELQSVVQELQRKFDKDSSFVHDQEEELKLVQQEIQEVQDQIQQANDFDKLQLENNLAEEQDRYRMLNEPLVGQRRGLQEQQAVLKQHQTVLNRRQGLPLEEGAAPEIDLGPVITQVQETQQQYAAELEKLEGEIQELQAAADEATNELNQQLEAQTAAKQELQGLEQELTTKRTTAAELWGKVNLYQELLQPIQDSLNHLREKLEAMTEVLNQSSAEEPALAEMRQIITSLTNPQAAELAAS